MIPPTAPAVAARAKAAVNTWRDSVGYCLRFARTMAGAPAMGGDAHSAWEAADFKHTQGTPPAGTFVFWRGGAHGHVAVSAGGGFCYTTDFRRAGRIDRVAIADIAKGWSNLAYRGWTEDVNGVRVTGIDFPPTPPKHKAAKHVRWHRELRRGMRGKDVRDLRRHLGYPFPGGFGKRTEAKVVAVQRKAGGSLGKADGIVGPKTWRTITGHH